MVSHSRLCAHPSVQLLYIHLSVFSFLENDLSKYQWIFTKLGMCIDIVESGLGWLMGKLHQFLMVLPVLLFHVFNFTFDYSFLIQNFSG